MLHSHVFVKDALCTNSIIPCGAIEEADEVISLFPDKLKTNFAVNLKGHGSIAFLNELGYTKQIEYLPRSLEILHEDYAR